MKTCNKCGIQLMDKVEICPSCGSDDFATATVEAPTLETPVEAPNINDNGNVLAGIVGAFLFALIGGALYFVIYQLGYIAGICGLVTFVLANFGYGLFARTKNKFSLVALISSIAITLLVIFAAEYLSVAYGIYDITKQEYYITFFDVAKLIPEFFADSEFLIEFLKDLGIAYLFTALACGSNVMNVIKARKNK
ncbi:MAG: hypothetical protein IJC49_03145 [Clostridia bacterium]|nr:hypothetical protein [Clostridia bacterium]